MEEEDKGTELAALDASIQYRDGLYEGSGKYEVPGGDVDTIKVFVEIEDNIVLSVDTEVGDVSGTSLSYYNLFKEGITGEVVGKNIADLSVGNINGASLTPIGFNRALDRIRSVAL